MRKVARRFPMMMALKAGASNSIQLSQAAEKKKLNTHTGTERVGALSDRTTAYGCYYINDYSNYMFHRCSKTLNATINGQKVRVLISGILLLQNNTQYVLCYRKIKSLHQ